MIPIQRQPLSIKRERHPGTQNGVVGRPREVITLTLQVLKVGEQMLLPFEQSSSQLHTRAQRLGMKIATRKIMKFESEWTELRRIA